jgi:hypothetical protein
MPSLSLILAGQLLGTAFACGLNLYATVALIGLASRLDWIVELPPGMRGLENGVVIGAAVALFVVEFIVDRIPYADTTWEAVHTIIRPGAAGLLAILALQGAPELQAAAAAAAVITALAAHGSKAGVRLILATRRPPRGAPGRGWHTVLRTAVSLLEDALAIGLAVGALLFPDFAVLLLGALLMLLLLAGPRLWRAAMLGLNALVARVRGFFGRRGWRTREQMPGPLRSAVPIPPLGSGAVRALRATAIGMPDVASYRFGWLVFSSDGPHFVHRRFFRSRATPLPEIAGIRIQHGVLTDVLELSTNGPGRRHRSFTLHLLKDGPPAYITAAELESNGT